MKILVTGASGFVGSHLIHEINTLKTDSVVCLENKNADIIDIRQSEELEKAIANLEFDSVIHLAGQSFVPRSFENPKETYDINFSGTFNLLNALKKINFKGVLLFVGSSDCYGNVDVENLPIKEEQPLKPRNPYAVSKVSAEALCYQWSQTGPFKIVMTRSFNHIGPGQNDRFVVPAFAKQIVQIKRKEKDPLILVGDLDVTRDFTDVRDIVHAYHLLLRKGKNGVVYNICSGKEMNIRLLLEKMIDISNVEVLIKQDPALFRPQEHSRIWGSFEKIAIDTGWKPQIPIEATLKDVLEDFEKRKY